MRNRRFPVVAGCLLAAALAVVGCSGGGSAVVAPAQPEEPVGPPLFEDVTAASGVAFTYKNGEEAGNFAIIESLGGGAALLDYDGDGLLDVFLPGGGHYRDKTVLGHPCKLYRNLGGFKFEDVTAKAGLDRVTFQYSHGAAAFDYDRDGRPDLLVTGYSRLVLLHNDGDGRFTDVTAKAGLNDKLWSASAGWGDLDGDGFPEVYVTHYGDWGFDTNHPTDCTYDGKTRDVCQPRRFKALPHTLYRNTGNGTFADITPTQNLRTDGKGLGVLVADLNNDGRPDVYVANDTDDNFLYVNRGKAGGPVDLKEGGLFSGMARDDRGMANGSMGLDAADFNRTGLASVVVTNYENELPALYRNRSGPGKEQFTYDTLPSGLAVVGGSYVSWGTGFFDYDLDGWDDLMIVSGHAIRFPTKIDRRQTPLLLRNEAGKFKPVTRQAGPYFRSPHNARGLAVGDLDNDGRPDLVVSHLNEPVSVLRNVADGKNWLGLVLAGEKNRDVVGARVVVTSAGGTQTKFAKGGGSFASTCDPRLLVGLGADAAVTGVTVHWPSGKTQEFSGVTPGAYWVLTEGGVARRR
ncbi:CRTAC1 family protein [Urbifossiella limnaea]|uniref:FG-GAP repeat protein n=1 Tax=Urbifossiella limnaea TaxID=2528023 RepID=A0A517Y0A6_9BACT|nr:CRTAC1 family protein [Urbifossiella limnaea]QDU23197.1 FG-GAP repeat protein [Urbifossiella limnaea]